MRSTEKMEWTKRNYLEVIPVDQITDLLMNLSVSAVRETSGVGSEPLSNWCMSDDVLYGEGKKIKNDTVKIRLTVLRELLPQLSGERSKPGLSLSIIFQERVEIFPINIHAIELEITSIYIS